MHLVSLHPIIRHEPRLLIGLREASWLSWIKQSVHKILAVAIIFISFIGFLQPGHLTALACSFKKMHPFPKHSYSLNKKSTGAPTSYNNVSLCKRWQEHFLCKWKWALSTLVKNSNAFMEWLLEKEKRMDFGGSAFDMNLSSFLSMPQRLQATY